MLRAARLAPVLLLWLAGSGCGADPHQHDPIAGGRKPDDVLLERDRAERVALAELERLAPLPPDAGKRILFGDLHVHSSYSWDGFLLSLPLAGGEGVHPPNDVCDFARYCANLDFFALTDHAETLLPEHWEASQRSVRECNRRAGDRRDPDLVAFMGFEWSQAGLTPATHYGHRCVLFPDDAEDRLPARPISSADRSERMLSLRDTVKSARWLAPHLWQRHQSYIDYLQAVSSRPVCADGIDTRRLPRDCQEIAPTPADLYRKLDEWGFPVLTIPHGTTWGTYTPATSTIDKHLSAEMYDAERMRLIEIMSGHGNSESYRGFRELELDAQGKHVCPAPSADYLPCCWQAGEIMRARCGDLPAAECERRVALARDYAAQAYTRPHAVFPDSKPEDWLDCGQCRDCFKPAFGYRPRESVQYAMALSASDTAGEPPRRFRYGFVGSSDNHTGRPGAGYKQLEPKMMSDVRGEPAFPFNHLELLTRGRMADPRQPELPPEQAVGVRGNDLRTTSFLYPGGLAAVHARDGSSEEIWAALLRREVYGTSGPRILLWFDLTNADGGRAPMGCEQALSRNPSFEVRAVGSFEQKPGCPQSSRAALPDTRLERLCRNECYHPGDTRRRIDAIEVIRIRPQGFAGEPVDALIEDPWRVFPCAAERVGCVVRFSDEEFLDSKRDALYYVRALEEPSAALNGAPLRTEFDAQGNAIRTHPCSPAEVDGGGCPAPVQERAWSSPIFVDQAGER